VTCALLRVRTAAVGPTACARARPIERTVRAGLEKADAGAKKLPL